MMLGELLLLAAAVWRLSSLLVYERGPFAVFDRLRALVGIVDGHNGAGEKVRGLTIPGNWLLAEVHEAMKCLWCTSVWVAGPVAAAWYWLPWWVVAVFAASGLAIMADTYVAQEKS